MSWKETDAMRQRAEFVVRALQRTQSLSALCREYRISRKTGYKWLRRYEQVGRLQELGEQSRRPHHSPSQTSEELELLVERLRQEYGWGSKKLRCLLEREHGVTLPAVTIHRILKRRGLVVASERLRPAVRRFERAQPNELWQMDFKGDFAFSPSGGRCYPLSILDDHSRFAVGLYGLSDIGHDSAQRSLTDCFERYGVPEAMLMDHGVPWWSTTNGHGLTRLAVFLIGQGIELLHGAIRHPQTQGKVERFHRTLDQTLRFWGLPKSWRGFQDALTKFRQQYNEQRPHEALGMAVPASRYQPSRRAFQPDPPEWEYPFGADVRKLNSAGCVDYQGYRYFVCEALAGQRVWCQPFAQRVLVHYRQTPIRELDLTAGRTTAVVLPALPDTQS